MTDEQLEAACRRFCKLMALDPDQSSRWLDSDQCAHYGPRWQAFMNEARSHLAWHQVFLSVSHSPCAMCGATVCDECGATIPLHEPSMMSDSHESSCSLYQSASI